MNSSYYNRKGQTQLGISSIGVIALSLLVAAVILGVGGTILEKIQNTQTDLSNFFGNETLTWAGNNTAMGLAEGRIITSSLILYNNATIVNKGSGDDANYTVSSGSITIINSSAGPTGVRGSDLVTSDLNVSYNYNYGSEARNSSDFGLQGVSTIAEFIPTIALVAVAAIVIGIVLVMFGRRRKEE